MKIDITLTPEEKAELMSYILALRPSTQLSTPTGLTGQFSVDSVSLDWDDNPEGSLAGYYVYRSSPGSGVYTRLTPTPVATSDYIDTNPMQATLNSYRVTAVEAGGANESPQSLTLVVDVPLSGAITARSTFEDRGTTIVMDSAYVSGLFYGNHWWIKIPDTGALIIDKTPAVVGALTDPTLKLLRHGAMINPPKPDQTAPPAGTFLRNWSYDGSNAFTTTARANQATPGGGKLVDPAPGRSFTVKPGDQLVCVVSKPDSARTAGNSIFSRILSASVFTFVDAIISDKQHLCPAFHKPVADTILSDGKNYKRRGDSANDPWIFPVSRVNYDLLPSLSSAGITSIPLYSKFKPRMNGINVGKAITGQDAATNLAPDESWVGAPPESGSSNIDYASNWGKMFGDAACLLCLDPLSTDKQELALKFIQQGIFLYGMWLQGTRWFAKAGHGMGHLFPILFAGYMLGCQPMRDLVLDYYNANIINGKNRLPNTERDDGWRFIPSSRGGNGNKIIYDFAEHGHFYGYDDDDIPDTMGPHGEIDPVGVGVPVVACKGQKGYLKAAQVGGAASPGSWNAATNGDIYLGSQIDIRNSNYSPGGGMPVLEQIDPRLAVDGGLYDGYGGVENGEGKYIDYMFPLVFPLGTLGYMIAAKMLGATFQQRYDPRAVKVGFEFTKRMATAAHTEWRTYLQMGDGGLNGGLQWFALLASTFRMISYTAASAVGTFVHTETITGSTSGATGIIYHPENWGSTYGAFQIRYTPVSGSFAKSEIITGGTSGAHVTTTATALPLSNVPAACSVVSLGGEEFVVTNLEGTGWRNLRVEEHLMFKFKGKVRSTGLYDVSDKWHFATTVLQLSYGGDAQAVRVKSLFTLPYTYLTDNFPAPASDFEQAGGKQVFFSRFPFFSSIPILQTKYSFGSFLGSLWDKYGW